MTTLALRDQNQALRQAQGKKYFTDEFVLPPYVKYSVDVIMISSIFIWIYLLQTYDESRKPANFTLKTERDRWVNLAPIQSLVTFPLNSVAAGLASLTANSEHIGAIFFIKII